MNEIAQQQETAMTSFIERAAGDKDVDIDKFERLIALQNQERDRQAKMAYNSDMALMQSEMPTISEKGQIVVKDQLRSKYARYEDIVEAVKPLFAKYGFYFSAKTDFDQNMLIVEGTIGHKLGHEETTKMRLPFDCSGSKNNVQAIGSSVSYGKRYVISMLLNIATGGEDDDGADAQPPQQNAKTTAGRTLNKSQLETLRETMRHVNVTDEYVCQKAQVGSIEEIAQGRLAGCLSHLNSLSKGNNSASR